ncbi:MAG: lysophospholipid acyltransferase family protein [Syntrophales bacterium]|nr:lysophospholipid acyltransferase family protein [Syntrophales bacterium]
MLKKYRYAILSRHINFLLCQIIRLYSLTLRLKVENEGPWLDHLRQGGKVLLCVWHQQFFAAIGHFKSYESFHPSLMISQSKDGDIIARIAKNQGWHAVRGSSSRDGAKAMKEVMDRINVSGLAGHIVDGPRGPAGTVKAGVISMARTTNAVVVPFYTKADRAWYFNSWDRFMMPKPFAKVTLHFGEMMTFEATDDDHVFESQRVKLENVMRLELI